MARPLTRWTASAAAVAVASAAGCGAADADPRGAAGGRAAGDDGGDAAWFEDVAAASGLDFVHTTGASGAYYFPEISAGGCGFIDYDGDGDLDVYATQAYPLPGPPTGDAGRNRLFRNDLDEPGGRLRFTDVTPGSGAGDAGYGMGMAVGDCDNDGDADLYVTNFGPNRLYRNRGDGTFEAAAADVPAEDRWSTSAAFLDYDNDGFLDLFVVNYVNFSLRENKRCHSPSGRRDYCGPQSFDPVPDRLFRNRGDGTFEDVTVAAGIGSAFGSGLGVVCADFDGDGRPDVYIANDGNANQLWMNRGDGTFEDRALLAGAAYNAEGRAEAGMGVDAADFDLDGDQDIFLAHLDGEHNTLLLNDGRGFFDDRTEDFALAAPSWPYTGFGTGWADFDGDTYPDLFVANGAVTIVEAIAFDPYPYGNPNQLMANLGPPQFTFTEVSGAGGPAVTAVETSRGAAFGDVDNDGDVDVLVSNSNGPLRLLRNGIGARRPWLALRLTGTRGNRDAIGAVVRLLRPSGPPLLRRVHTDGSYQSAGDRRVHFGLGDARGPQTVEVRWPGGRREVFEGIAVGELTELREGAGVPPS